MTLTDQEILNRVEGQTVPTAFMATVAEHADIVALRWMSGDDWLQLTFAEYAERVASAAAGLRALGVGPGDRVVIMMRNIPEFHIVDMAAVFLGATPISIYNSSSADQIAYLVGDCEAKVAVLEHDGFLERFRAARDRLPALESIVTLHDDDGDDTMPFAEFMGHDPVDLSVEVTNASPEDLVTVIYTSGTTGNPKGVMLNHLNVVWTGESLRETFPFDETAGVKVMSYLPMAHVAERMVSHYAQTILGFQVICCPEVSELTTYIGAVHPQIMFGVPRVWEKIHAGITAALSADPEKERQVAEAVEAALPIMTKMDAGTATEDEIATWNFLDEVAFSTIRALLGFDEMMLAVSGAAPISQDLLSWFRAIGINLCEVYGMSESSGPMTFTVEKPKVTGAPAIPGSEVALADDGEVIFRGSNVFVGYLNQPEKTAETLIDGWLHSGDIGTIDEDGYLTIVDRKKELIVTAGGKNISPSNLEAELKMIDIVSQAAAIGDQRKFVSALLVLDPEVAPVWARKNGIEFDTLDDLAEDDRVRAHIDEGVAEAMEGFNSAEAVKRWVILGDEWEPDSDVLTPTSKLKRRGILARYQDQIDTMYA